MEGRCWTAKEASSPAGFAKDCCLRRCSSWSERDHCRRREWKNCRRRKTGAVGCAAGKQHPVAEPPHSLAPSIRNEPDARDAMRFGDSSVVGLEIGPARLKPLFFLVSKLL